MGVTEVAGGLRVETTDLAAAALASGGAGNSLYDATPGDGTWAAAPNEGAEDTYSPPFTAASFTVKVQTAAVEIRVSSDGGANFGLWIVLEPGSHSFDLDATDIEIREDVDDAGAEYQIVAFA
jgi:hypothetical protein